MYQNHNDIDAHEGGGGCLPWLFLPMEGIECLSFTDDVLDNDPDEVWYHG
jgi:hypothetical protein